MFLSRLGHDRSSSALGARSSDDGRAPESLTSETAKPHMGFSEGLPDLVRRPGAGAQLVVGTKTWPFQRHETVR
jgi:hypothetical protein